MLRTSWEGVCNCIVLLSFVAVIKSYDSRQQRGGKGLLALYFQVAFQIRGELEVDTRESGLFTD